jgi:hypothetical protein
VVELRNWAVILMDGAGGTPSTDFSPGADSVSRGQLQGNAATTGATVPMMLWCVLFVYVHVLMWWCIAKPLHVNYAFSKYDNVCTHDMWNALVCNMLIPDVPSCASYGLHGCLVWVTPEHHQFRWLWLVFNKINCTSILNLGSCPGTSLHAWMPGSRTRTAVHAK